MGDTTSGQRALRRGLGFLCAVALLGPALLLLGLLPLLHRLFGDPARRWWPATSWCNYALLLPRATAALERRMGG